MTTDRPLMRFADNQLDEWTERAEIEAARWLRLGLHPDQINPASGLPLEGGLDRVDPHGDPSVAETLLRSSDEVLGRERRRTLIVRGVGAALVLAAVVGGLWIGGAL